MRQDVAVAFLSGLPLWHLRDLSLYFDSLRRDDPGRYVSDLERPGDHGLNADASAAAGVVYTALPLTWSVVRALWLALKLDGDERVWEEIQPDRVKARQALRDESLAGVGPWPVYADKVARLQRALELLLDLDPDAVRAMPDPAEAMDYVEVIRDRLDALERRISHRGNWPR